MLPSGTGIETLQGLNGERHLDCEERDASHCLLSEKHLKSAVKLSIEPLGGVKHSSQCIFKAC